jgi:Ser/Thr protein kinase RdoA (MazF antagonist)
MMGSDGNLLAHGMGTELVPPSWPVLTDAEIGTVLGRYSALGSGRIEWLSPRPMSAAALLTTESGPVFLKRHHRAVRTGPELAEEHAFQRHLHASGIPTAIVHDNDVGQSATELGTWTYELHSVPCGLDLYRDALSWTPFRTPGHAHSAGAMLGRLHTAARDFPAPRRRTVQLVARFDALAGPDPLGRLDEIMTVHPELAAALETRSWRSDLEATLLPRHDQLAPLLPALAPRWTHNDWHASNLLWTADAPDATVAAVLDFGLADRTTAIFDLATALERNTIGWLAPADDRPVQLDQAAALIVGYASQAELSPAERAALPLLLPIVHVEFAVSELAYFHGIVDRPADAGLAYDGYLLGHTRWFDSPTGRGYLGELTAQLADLSW